jgi:hypothetical protein
MAPTSGAAAPRRSTPAVFFLARVLGTARGHVCGFSVLEMIDEDGKRRRAKMSPRAGRTDLSLPLT